MKQIVVLGSTGSIGRSTLDVIASHSETMNLLSIAAHRSWESMAEQSQTFRPKTAVLADAEMAKHVDPSMFHQSTALQYGGEEIEKIASDSQADLVIAGIVGVAGLRGTWAAIEAGKTVGLANKETLVVAGSLVTDLARENHATIIPVDSEHSAIFQALQSGTEKEVARIVLTASGGPFRGWSSQQLQDVTPEMALQHPTWKMGKKITVDSATMMNKALEIIEARWLFGIESERIEVVVHPQSMIHSFVEFIDGSVIAQISPPDMRLPIQYALTWPQRMESVSRKLDWMQSYDWNFQPPDRDAFPALDLGFEAASRGGTCGAVLNAANEAAVARFLNNEIGFGEIPRACRAVLDSHNFDPSPSLDDLLKLDKKTREEIQRW